MKTGKLALNVPSQNMNCNRSSVYFITVITILFTIPPLVSTA